MRKQLTNGSVSTVDRLPPNSPECEQSILGCILMDARQVIPLCIEKFKAGPSVFYDQRHSVIYQTMIELWDEGDPVDTVTVYERLKCWGKAEQVGGLAYISPLADVAVSAANAPSHIQILTEKHTLRQMIRVCTESVGRMYDADGHVDELMESVEANVLSVAEGRIDTSTPDVRTLVNQAVREIEQLHERQGMISGVSTGFLDLDRMIDGMHGGDMIVLAARPSIGKTSLLLNIMDNVVVEQRLPAGIISMEMTGRQLVLRMLCSRAHVNSRNIRDGFMTERDYPKIVNAQGAIGGSPLFIDDAAGLSILQIRARARRWVQQHDIKVLGVDYLQLANAGGRVDNRQQEVAIISTGIKTLAKELNIPVLILCQLNRDIEREKARAPRLSDLRESGSIEQDADVVIMLHKLRREGDQPEADAECVPINALIAKNRNGPVGEVSLTFLKGYTRFESAARVSDADVPSDSPQTSMPYND